MNYNNKKLLKTLQGHKFNKPPVWLMRQAGRYLPEYREVRKQAGSFLDLCYNPALTTEVTLQPLRRFNLDGAILFADILLIPHALGQHLEFKEGIGPILEPLKNNEDIEPSNILFFTSVSNSIPGFLYDDFLKSLSEKYHNNVLIPKEKEDLKKLPSDSRLTVISHASGAIEALKYAKNKKVKNLILIDPVDNRLDKLTGKKSKVSIESFWDDEEEDQLSKYDQNRKIAMDFTSGHHFQK